MTGLIVVLSIVSYYMAFQLSYLYPEGNEAAVWIRRAAYALAMYIFTMNMRIWTMNCMIAFEHKEVLLLFGVVFGTIIRIPFSYFMIIVAFFQLPGHYLS